MPKRSTLAPMVLPPRPGGRSLEGWLYDAIRAEILEGRLRGGVRLPATRELARQYGISRGPVVAAFEQLTAEGYVEGTTGSGTYVAKSLPDELLQAGRPPAPPSRPRHAARRPTSEFARRARLFPELREGRARAFRANQPALDLFPASVWAQVASRRLRRATPALLRGCSPIGHRPLREAVADYLSRSRQVHCTPDQVLVVSGVQEALDLSTRLLVGPGGRVAMEHPGYVGARHVFHANAAQVVRLTVDDEGVVIHRQRMKGARLLYVTPAHQFPLGVTMSLARRLSALEWARETGALILEDDYDSEYRYSGRPLPALQGLGGESHVIFAGSFGKVLFPSLRLGYLVVPPDLVDRFAAALSITKRHAPLLDQATLADFMEASHFARHIRRMRRIYGERLQVLVESAKQELQGRLDISNVEAGLQTVGWLRRGVDSRRVAEEATRQGLEVTPLVAYGHAPRAAAGLHLGFAACDEDELRRGVRVLAEVIRRVGKGG